MSWMYEARVSCASRRAFVRRRFRCPLQFSTVKVACSCAHVVRRPDFPLSPSLFPAPLYGPLLICPLFLQEHHQRTLPSLLPHRRRAGPCHGSGFQRQQQATGLRHGKEQGEGFLICRWLRYETPRRKLNPFSTVRPPPPPGQNIKEQAHKAKNFAEALEVLGDIVRIVFFLFFLPT